MGNATRSAYSFRNQLDILSGSDALAGLSFVRCFRTLVSVICRNSGDSSKGTKEEERATRKGVVKKDVVVTL